ncbi:MAG: hypothetical protein LBN95_07975 [Prevotellaceae bacterium]|jgi:hypothetical protein|nr:hypothetical protein [Prevotellaceae bacterium]
MIFSKERWNDGQELNKHIRVSSSITFEKMYAPLKNAFELFIAPLLGEELTEDLINYYQNLVTLQPSDPAPSGTEESSEEKQKKFVLLAQRANALLAYWYDYTEISLFIGNNGINRTESDSMKTPYKYQEQELKAGFKEKGFNALDNLLLWLEKNIDDFPHFKDSANYTLLKKSIVRCTDDVHNYYFINKTGKNGCRFKRVCCSIRKNRQTQGLPN